MTATRRPERIRRILVPTDFSDASKRALAHAEGLASTLGASIDVLHVVDIPPYIGAELMFAGPERQGGTVRDWARSQAGEQMEEFVSAASGVAKRITTGSPVSTISRLADEEDFDLIVMSTHGRTGLAGVLVGSVATGVIRTAPCPVMVVRS